VCDLEPPIHQQALPAGVAANRAAADAEAALLNPLAQPSIDRHIAIYQAAVDALVAVHRSIADGTDIEMRGYTRWSATWEMAGRCLAIGNVLLHDLRGGFASEAIGTLRALHEAAQLLSALAFHEEEEVLRRWLEGEYIPPRTARAVQGRKQALALERMQEAGIEPVGGDVVELGRQVYEVLSIGSHHRRAAMEESVAPVLRRFAYGPHPSVHVRAANVEFAGHALEEVVIIVGDSFADILGGDFYLEQVRPLIDAMNAVRAEAPLSDD
jgi:hypothetical protein